MIKFGMPPNTGDIAFGTKQLTFMHHKAYRAAGRAGDEEHIDKT